MRILAVGAHPDDIEILCAGALARCRERGDDVKMCIATDGAAGHRTRSADELRRVRREEAEKAAEVLGAALFWVGIPDGQVRSDEHQRRLLIEVVRRAKPDVLITHPPEDYHPDHVAVSVLARDASFLAPLKNLETESAPTEAPPAVFFMDTVAGLGFEPEVFVDVTDVYNVKKRMLECHESQLEFLKDATGADFLSGIDIGTRFRGLQCGVERAEAFRRWRVFPRMGTERLLP